MIISKARISNRNMMQLNFFQLTTIEVSNQKLHCVHYHKPWCQNTKYVFNVFLLTKTSRGLKCNPYIQNFDHPLQNTTKYVVLHFCCCEFPKSYSILTWWDVCYVLSHSRNHAIFKWCDFSPFHLFFISGIPWIFNRVIQK